MAFSIFKSFRSTVSPFLARDWFTPIKMLVDPTTGSPVGIQSPNANGPDGIWAPIDITAAQLANPSAVMLADLNAVYRLNVAPYTRYTSTGNSLVSYSGADIQGPNGLWGNMVVYSPFIIDNPEGISIRGQIQVRTFP